MLYCSSYSCGCKGAKTGFRFSVAAQRLAISRVRYNGSDTIEWESIGVLLSIKIGFFRNYRDNGQVEVIFA